MRQEGTDAMLERLAELAEAHYVFPEVGAAGRAPGGGPVRGGRR